MGDGGETFAFPSGKSEQDPGNYRDRSNYRLGAVAAAQATSLEVTQTLVRPNHDGDWQDFWRAPLTL